MDITNPQRTKATKEHLKIHWEKEMWTAGVWRKMDVNTQLYGDNWSHDDSPLRVTRQAIRHVFSFFLLWHAPLGARNAIRRHQPPQRSTASLNVRLRVLRSRWMVFNHMTRGCPGGLLQFSGRGAVKVI